MASQISGLIPFQKVEYIQYVFSRKVIPLKSLYLHVAFTFFNAPADNFMSLILPCWYTNICLKKQVAFFI